jgi:3-hydroxymyristoyl/3-hydroxydecanoyl-(acyl carrier protein) dehydratase
VNLRHALKIGTDHPAFAGHFPGMPILPGAVLLDEALRAIELKLALDLTQWQIASAKFLEIVRPGDALTIEHTSPANGTIGFTVLVADRAGLARPALAGTLSLAAGGARER